MLLGGDERGRTQRGNNNAWCQDNELSWFDWRADEQSERLLSFTRRLVDLRRRHPVLRRASFFRGTRKASRLPDAWWFRPDGLRMAQRDWQQADGAIGIFLNGEEIDARTPRGDHVLDDSFVALVNAHAEPVDFVLPARRFGAHWEVELSTAAPDSFGSTHNPRETVRVEAYSLVLLRRSSPG
jgi:glycogen operon protein